MAPCRAQKYNVQAPSYLSKIPCRVAEEEENETCTCGNIVLQDLIDAILESSEEKGDANEKQKLPCEDVKPPSKKKFEQIGLKQICALPYTRKWTLEDVPCSDTNELPKWFKWKPRKKQKGKLTPRELDDYEKSLWVPICKPPEKIEEECMEPVDVNLCVFCLEHLLTGGYIHELHEKVPLIKKQSELYGDEIAQRIGIRTRVTVHKKCYLAYIDVFAHKKEKEEIDLNDEVDEDSEDLNCGEEEEEDEEEEENMKSEKEKQAGKTKRKEQQNGISPPPDIKFCLKKYTLPPFDPGK